MSTKTLATSACTKYPTLSSYPAPITEFSGAPIALRRVVYIYPFNENIHKSYSSVLYIVYSHVGTITSAYKSIGLVPLKRQSGYSTVLGTVSGAVIRKFLS